MVILKKFSNGLAGELMEVFKCKHFLTVDCFHTLFVYTKQCLCLPT